MVAINFLCHSAARLSLQISESRRFSCAHPPHQRRVRRYHGVRISLTLKCGSWRSLLAHVRFTCAYVFTFAFSPKSLNVSAIVGAELLNQERLRGSFKNSCLLLHVVCAKCGHPRSTNPPQTPPSAQDLRAKPTCPHSLSGRLGLSGRFKPCEVT